MHAGNKINNSNNASHFKMAVIILQKHITIESVGLTKI